MKIKNIFQIIGIRGKSKHFGYRQKKVDLDQGISLTYAQWLHPGESDKEISKATVDAYRKILNEGDFCIDIGAHSGDSTLPIALAVGKSGCVLALEPNPYVYHVLEKNARSNRSVVNIETIMAAASSIEGFMTFEYSDSGYCNGGRHEGISVLKHGHAFNLEVYCVDIEKELYGDYRDLLPKLKFIKVDTEGYDLYVLRALQKIIREYRPIIKAEVFKKTDKKYRFELYSFFNDLGYSVHRIAEEPVKAGVILAEENLEEFKHYDIICHPV